MEKRIFFVKTRVHKIPTEVISFRNMNNNNLLDVHRRQAHFFFVNIVIVIVVIRICYQRLILVLSIHHS